MELPGIAKMCTVFDVEGLDWKSGLKMAQDHQIIPKKSQIETNAINLCNQIELENL